VTKVMTSGWRRFALTTHVSTSVGWFGAVATFLVLAVAGMTSDDPLTVRSAYLAMELTGWFIIVPLCLASLPTGLIMSLGTPWGLLRHYWVVAKLIISVIATILLLVHMQPVGHIARAVSETTLREGELAGLRMQLVGDAIAASVALLAATALSIYKPWGLTPYGARALRREADGTESPLTMPRALKVAIVAIATLGTLVVLHHLVGRGGH
jgi:hypothetical protein